MAAWIGERDGRLYRLLMIAPSHFMTLRLFDFNRPLDTAPLVDPGRIG